MSALPRRPVSVLPHFRYPNTPSAHFRPVAILVAMAIVGLLCLPTAGRAATKTWFGTTSDDWFDDTNWSPAGVPGASDDVDLNGGTVTCNELHITETVNSIGGDGTLTVSGFNFTLAVTNGGGTSGYLNLEVTNNAALATSGDLVLDDLVLDDAAWLVINGASTEVRVNDTATSSVGAGNIGGNGILRLGAPCFSSLWLEKCYGQLINDGHWTTTEDLTLYGGTIENNGSWNIGGGGGGSVTIRTSPDVVGGDADVVNSSGAFLSVTGTTSVTFRALDLLNDAAIQIESGCTLKSQGGNGATLTATSGSTIQVDGTLDDSGFAAAIDAGVGRDFGIWLQNGSSTTGTGTVVLENTLVDTTATLDVGLVSAGGNTGEAPRFRGTRTITALQAEDGIEIEGDLTVDSFSYVYNYSIYGIAGRTPRSTFTVLSGHTDVDQSDEYLQYSGDIDATWGDGVTTETFPVLQPLQINDGSTLTIAANATLEGQVVSSSRALDFFGPTPWSSGAPRGEFLNQGTVVMDMAGSTIQVGALDFRNEGTIELKAGTFAVSTGDVSVFTNAGDIILRGNATFDLDGATSGMTFEAGSTLLGEEAGTGEPAGIVTLRNATISGDFAVRDLDVTNNGSPQFNGNDTDCVVSTLDIHGTLSVSTSTTTFAITELLTLDTWMAFAGSGAVILGENATGTCAGASNVTESFGSDFLVRGDMTFSTSGTIQLQGPGDFIVEATGSVHFDGSGTRLKSLTASPYQKLFNEGLVEVANSSSTLTVTNLEIDSPGTFEVTSGTVDLASGVTVVQYDDTTQSLTGGQWIVEGAFLGFPGVSGATIATNDGHVVLVGPAYTLERPEGDFALRALTDNSGTIELDGASATFDAELVNTGSMVVLSGGGSIGGDFQNAGALRLEAGPGLDVAGSWSQSSTGETTSVVGGRSTRDDYGTLDAADVVLDGSIAIEFDTGFAPVVGDEFALLDYSSVTGVFADESGLPATSPPPASFDLEWVTEVGTSQYLARIQGYYNAFTLDLAAPELRRIDPESGLDGDFSSLTLSVSPDAARLSTTLDGETVFAVLDASGSHSAIAIDGFTGALLSEVTLTDEVEGLAISPRARAYDPDHDGGHIFRSRGGATVSVRSPGSGLADVIGNLSFARGIVERPESIVFLGSETDPEAELLAYSPDGDLYAFDATGGSPRIWTIDFATKEATLLGSSDASVNGADDMAFLGDRLFLIDGSTGEVFELDPTDASLIATSSTTVGQFGLTSRACIEQTPGLQVGDTRPDSGGSISLDWSSLSLPTPAAGSLVRVDVLRAVDGCALVFGGADLVGSATPGDGFYTDVSAVDYRTYRYRLNLIADDAGSESLVDSWFSGPVYSHPNVLISELATSAPGIPKRMGEEIELQNLSLDTIDLTGWRLSNGVESQVLSGSVAGGGFLVVTLTSATLDPRGDIVALLPPGSNALIDALPFGSEGGAPSAPAGFTISRVTGTTPDDPISTSYSLTGATLGAPNLAQPAQLGSSLVFNEVGYVGAASEDYVELFNPLGSTVRLDAFMLTDGVSFADTLDVPISLDAGDVIALQSSGPIAFDRDLTSTELYLYRLSDGEPPLLVDQLGWGPGDGDPPSPTPIAPLTSVTRVPDGAFLYLGDLGTNWLDSGGGQVLAYGYPTPGSPNIPPDLTVVTVDPDGGGDYGDLASALAGVVSGTAVLLEPGLYHGPVTVPHGVSLIGQAERSTLVVIDNSSPAEPALTLDGNDAMTRISNLTIRSSSARALGLVNSAAVIQSVRFVENRGSFDGGAVRVAGGTPRFEGCTFLRNRSTGNGGAVLVESGTPSFKQSLFFRNHAVNSGGAIRVVGGSVAVSTSVFEQNEAAVGSGIVDVAAGDVQVSTSLLTNNAQANAVQVEPGATAVLQCSVVFANGAAIDPVNVDIFDVVDANPQYCSVAALDFGYPVGSPADLLSQDCGATVGITGKGCADFVTPAPPMTRATTQLEKAVPNPFNPRTNLRFVLADRGHVHVDVFNLRGRRVRRVLDGDELDAGSHEVIWNGLDDQGQMVSSGVYLVRLRLDGQTRGPALKTMLIK